MRINNINGTSDNTCKCGNWLAHWKRFGGNKPSSLCAERSCTKGYEVGAHIQKDSSTDKNWYIVPLCKEHNGQTGKSLDIMDDTSLVSANVSQTCGK